MNATRPLLSVAALLIFSYLCKTSGTLLFKDTLADQNQVLSPIDTPLYATKTGYELSVETFGSKSERELNWFDLARTTGAVVPEGLENCAPDGVYVVYRHGTRNPGDGDVRDVHSILERLQNTEINPEFYYLREYPKLPVANASQLVEAGWRELKMLAHRLSTKRFPELFPDKDFDFSRYSFQSTNKSRTIDSARGFLEGLVGENQTCTPEYSKDSFTVECSENEGPITPTSTVIPHSPVDKDPLLRFYDVLETCTEAVNGGKTDLEQDTFSDGPEVGEVWTKVNQKLAPPGGKPFNLSRAEVILLSEMCGFDLAMHNDSNTWCKLFEQQDLYAPEYHSELKNYWNKAYGFSINYRISCELALDAINYLEKRVTMPTSTPLGNFKFGHSETIVPLVTLMGLFNDPIALLSSNFDEHINRVFRAGNMSPFAGNVAFALYRCNGSSDTVHRVQVLLNERPVKLDFCTGQFCSLEEFKGGIERAIGTCDFKEECAAALDDGQKNNGNINFSACLQFLLAYVALVGISVIRAS
ncbi:multiple inositol polyphosphate phosphatase 1-like [Asterias rubens]|uniref:multiple inositol polyphosphate phosphatase 1-like n=1 Tax=Asterias rubens TaxID=7604 RepID=UPI001455AC65|nr:multiple inositol polyphosphate phosphatase 1-like [Asterias rubens]